MLHNKKILSKEEHISRKNAKVRKEYSKPHLEKLGDLRSITFGSTPGITDSGGLGEALP